MKPAKIIFVLLFVVLFSSQESFCQDNKLGISALFGVGDYGGPLGGCGWDKGNNYSLSGEYSLFSHLSLALQADYSTYKFTEPYAPVPDLSSRHNRVYSLSGEIIPKLWVFNIILGGGLSYQKVDEVKYYSYSKEENKTYTQVLSKGDINLRGHAIAGVGIEIKVIQGLDVLFQTRSIIRHEYALWFLETGLKYNF